MYIKITLSIFFIISIFSFGFGHSGHFTDIPYGMQKEVESLLKYPKTRSLLDRIKEEGAISLQWIFIKEGFDAFWWEQKRIIALNSFKQWEEGEKLYSLLFELQNALTTPQFAHLDKMVQSRHIGKEDYVRNIEIIEYQNALRAVELLEGGIRSGYFPQNTPIPVFPNLQEHLKIQKHCDHSTSIAKKYDALYSNEAGF